MSKGKDKDNSVERTILCLSITQEDKKKLRILAAERDTTIASIIHEWIEKYSNDIKE